MQYPVLAGNHPWLRPAKIGFDRSRYWPDKVDLGALLPPLIKTIRTYVAISERDALVVALWAMHTHLAHWFVASPRLVIRSDGPKSGKTTLMGLLSALVPRPLDACGGRGGAMLDSIGLWPTYLIDRANERIGRDRDIRSIIADGYHRFGSKLLRKDKRAPRYVNLFSPAAVAVEGRTPALLHGCSIEITLQRLKPGQKVKRDPGYNIPDNILELQLKMARWADDNDVDVCFAKADREPGEDVNWAPLLILAFFAGPEWEQKVRAALGAIEAQSAPNLAHRIIADIRAIFHMRNKGGRLFVARNGQSITDLDRIRSTDLARLLGEMEDRPWREWGPDRKPITAHGLANLLAEVKLRPLMLRFHTADESGCRSSVSGNGYQAEQFDGFGDIRHPPADCSSGDETNPDKLIVQESSGVFEVTDPDMVSDRNPDAQDQAVVVTAV